VTGCEGVVRGSRVGGGGGDVDARLELQTKVTLR
jgi:hypothetical protein